VEPFAVAPVGLAPGAEPPAGPVRDLTARIERALGAVTLQAERAEAHALVERAQRIITAQDATPAPRPSLAEEFALAAAGLDPRQLAPASFTGRRVARYVGTAALFFLLLLPAALAGVALHYPAYRAVGFVATGVAKGAEDALASVKVLAAMLLFPLTWVLVGVAGGVRWGAEAGVLALLVAPLTAYAALLFFERLDRVIGAARALGLFLLRRWAFLRLLAERNAIQEQIVALGREIGAS
jgi:MFS family permease